MSKELSEETSFNVSIKTLIGIGVGLSTLIGMWFALQADIQEAKELPEPEISRTEYDLKDKLIRETIMNTGKKVEENSEALKKIDDKLYEIIKK
jgi:ribosomal protein S13